MDHATIRPKRARRHASANIMKLMVGWYILMLSWSLAVTAQAELVHVVCDRAALIQAVRQAQPGTTVRIAPGQYEGNLFFANLRGTGEAPIIITADDPANPPVFVGGNEGLKLSGVAYVELHHLVFDGAKNNGVNIDDAGNAQQPTTMIVLRHVTVRNLSRENHAAGIKLSGVFDFEVTHCLIENWGSSAAGIDMVGCHRGRITHTTLRGDKLKPSAVGIQVKGGSTQIVIHRCRFEDAGQRGVNIGGRTGHEFFRPRRIMGYEARDVTVEGSVFVGSEAPIAFASAQDGLVRFNTFYQPGKWIVRVLQDAQGEMFKACAGGVFTDNLIVFRSEQMSPEGAVNVGAGTHPASFTFARNFWYCENQPGQSRVRIAGPMVQVGDRFGSDPLLVNPAEGDFNLKDDSPARGFGHTGLR